MHSLHFLQVTWQLRGEEPPQGLCTHVVPVAPHKVSHNFHLSRQEKGLVNVNFEPSSGQPLYDLQRALPRLLGGVTHNDNVVNVNDDPVLPFPVACHPDDLLEVGGGRLETKGHPQVLVSAILRDKSCVRDVIWVHGDVVVPGLEI